VAPDQPAANNPLDLILDRLANADDPLIATWAADLLVTEEAGAQQCEDRPTPAA
jgi:hypothetical protein